MENLLFELSRIENKGLEPKPSYVNAKAIGLSMTETEYYLGKLVKMDLVSDLLSIGSPTRNILKDAEIGYLVERGINGMLEGSHHFAGI